MNIHEYQAKELLAKFGVPVPAGFAGDERRRGGRGRGEAPRAALCRQGADPCRRPRQGQVQGAWRPTPRAASGSPRALDEVRAQRPTCSATRSSRSRPARAGKQVNRLYVTDGVDIAKEFYLALLVDRETGRIASSPRPRAAWTSRRSRTTRPRRSTASPSIPATGFMPHHGRAVAYALGLDGDLAKQAQQGRSKQLYDAFLGTDAAQIEINPLAVDRRRQAARARRQGRLRFATPSSAIQISTRCATRARRIRWSSRRRNTTSPTSSSTAISAAWSTAPASPWRRWTSSS